MRFAGLVQFRIRKALETDADQMAGLCRELGYPVAAHELNERLRATSASRDDVVLVAESPPGALLGWTQAHVAQVIESGYRAEIVGLVVSASARRGGVGRALVEAAEAWARAMDAAWIVVRSNVARTESHSFYPALGYVPIKTQRVYRKDLP